MTRRIERILLTGATGFVGQALYPVLVDRGFEVVCASRNPGKAQRKWPDRSWVKMDVDDLDSIRGAMRGCRSAYYLIHRMADVDDFEEREARSALNFVDAAAEAGIERIVYLGGLHPRGEPARHLRSRLVTGAILRSGSVSTVELRASVIVGSQSASWQILRDVARRLPVMLCPTWLRNHTEPVAIDDVTHALAAAVELEAEESVWYSLPGPEVLTFQECIERVAKIMGRHPVMVSVPLLTPRLSSYWLRLITGADYHVARALAEGLKDDLVAEDNTFWEVIDHRPLISFDEAVRRALVADQGDVDPPASPGERPSWSDDPGRRIR